MSLNINLEFDAAAMAAPASFRTGLQNAASLLDAAITTPITVNIQIRYGENGIAATSAEAGAVSGGVISYAAARADLIANAQAGDSNFNALPTGSINGQSSVEIWRAQAKAFGLIGATNTGLDGIAIFGTGISSNLLVGVALHELAHAMGRVPDNTPDIFEFYRYTSAGNRLFSNSVPAAASYFSVDGGNTKLADYGQNSDPSDFLNGESQTTNDPFDEFYGSSTLQQLTSLDLTQLDALGFNTMLTPSFDTSWTLAGVGDFNGDGKSDLAYFNSSLGATEIELLNGTKATIGGPIANNPFGVGWAVVAIGDFTGNGKSDLVWQNASTGLVEIQLINGSAGAGGGPITNNPFDSSWSIVGVGNFTGTGRDSLVWRRGSDGIVEVQYLNGNGGAGGGVLTNSPFDTSWNMVAVGDFTGSGNSNLVWQNPSTGVVEIQFLSGTTATGGGVLSNNPFDSNWSIVGTGDFLGNGKSDLVWQNNTNNAIEIEFLNGNTATGGGAVQNSPFDNSWRLAGIGDFNGDGKADLVWRRISDGLTETQFMNGNTAMGGGTLSSTGMSATSTNAQVLTATQTMAAVPAGAANTTASPPATEETSLQNTLAPTHQT